MNQTFWGSVAFNVGINVVLVVEVEAEGIENLGEGEVGQMGGDDFFGGDAESPEADDRPNAGAGLGNDGFTGENFWVASDIAGQGFWGHG